MTLPPARLSIWIKGKVIPQGKFFYREHKPCFLVNITKNKWFRIGGGYTIAAQILEAFTKAKVRPQILYRLTDKGITYSANKSKFYSKGVLIPWGSHRQYCLPIKNWEVFREVVNEPFHLPDMTVDNWLKEKEEPHIVEDFSMSVDIMERLRPSAVKLGII
jgi:hypothetical protein